MTYNRLIPDQNLDMEESITDFQLNWDSLATIFDENHYTYDDSVTANRGKHRQVTLVEQSANEVAAIVPAGNEIAIYAKESDSLTEIFMKNEEGKETQITKNSELYLGMIPVAGVNFTGAGAIQGTAYRISSVTRNPSGAGNHVYKLTILPALPDTDYTATITGFDDSSNPVIGTPWNDATSVDTDFLIVQFLNQNASPVTDLTAGMVTIWRAQ